MIKPLISICLVSYNHQEYITDCLSSVLTQYGAFRLEILIGDDQSTDKTVNILKDIISTYRGDANIRLFAHEKNLGASQNYQYLIRQAQGNFIAHLDGDDFWLPGKLQAQLSFLQENTDCPACYTNTLVIKNNKSYWGFFNPTIDSRISLSTLLHCGNFINHSSLLYHSINKEQILKFSENFIDYQIHLFLALSGDLGYINQVLVAYRINSSSSQLVTMKSQVLIMYVDALLAIKAHVMPSLFQAAIKRFYQVHFLKLYLNYDMPTRIYIAEQLQSYYSTNWKNILFDIIPFALKSELSGWLYKKIFKDQPRFLQHNGVCQ